MFGIFIEYALKRTRFNRIRKCQGSNLFRRARCVEGTIYRGFSISR